MTKYVKPHIFFISGSEEHREIYRLENRRDEIIMAVAKELQKFDWWYDKSNFWGEILVQVLYDILDVFSWQAGYVAAKAYVKYCEERFEGVLPSIEEEEENE